MNKAEALHCADALARLSAEQLAEAETYADSGRAENYRYFKSESDKLRDRSRWWEQFASTLRN